MLQRWGKADRASSSARESLKLTNQLRSSEQEKQEKVYRRYVCHHPLDRASSSVRESLKLTKGTSKQRARKARGSRSPMHLPPPAAKHKYLKLLFNSMCPLLVCIAKLDHRMHTPKRGDSPCDLKFGLHCKPVCCYTSVRSSADREVIAAAVVVAAAAAADRRYVCHPAANLKYLK